MRRAFTKDAVRTAAALAAHVPDGTFERLDLRYGAGRDETLDVFSPGPGGADRARPLVVWVHGGAWLSGDKRDVASYLKILAARGFVTVAINYSVAPGAQYPTPVEQTSRALTYLLDHADELGFDPSRIVLAGDSAGAHIVAQVASITTDPGYADRVGLAPVLTADQLAGVVLCCGPYDVRMVDLDAGGARGLLIRTVLRSYLGENGPAEAELLADLSITEHVSAAFPPAFVTAGNGDPFVAQSEALVERLRALEVRVDSLLYPPLFEPRLGHEYQFNLDRPAGQAALARIVTFLDAVTGHRSDGAG